MLALGGAGAAIERLRAAQALPDPRDGRLVRTMPLGRFDARPRPPMHARLGTGLDARQFTDLSGLSADRPTTPTERFFVRTSQPPDLPPPGAWRVALGAPGRAGDVQVEAGALQAEARPMGVHLMECSGNADPANFGLLSAASWTGVPLTAVLTRLPGSDGARIRVTGRDDDARPSQTSVPGAAWIFTRDEIARTGAFLATGMNEAPLTADHGAPVRLVVPNYYGCSCIKWVTRIDAVPDDEPATTQMREFSARTHQQGVPAVARDYEPPVIDLAATPIRVEQWQVGGHVVYRVVGIRWGGASRSAPLTIRFRHTEPFVPVESCPATDNPTTWSLWTHTWRPAASGRYQIALSTADRTIRTRRLDLFYYTREVEIDRI